MALWVACLPAKDIGWPGFEFERRSPRFLLAVLETFSFLVRLDF